MGYIIPVNHYQYSQYAERVVIKKYDPYRFVPINRIKPSVNPSKKKQSHELIPIQTDKNTSRKNHSVSNHRIEKLYGEITGKRLLYSDFA